MSDRSVVVYLYDGSYEGLLSCVFESFARKENPIEISVQDTIQTSFYPIRNIATDLSKAERVKKGICTKMSKEAYELVQLGYFTCHPQKEKLILEFIRIGMQCGRKVLSMLTDDTVHCLFKAVKHLTGESHQLKGFVRFSVYERIMAAVIEPKNFVLPLLAPHFCDRYANDAFMIYDKTHLSMLFYKPYEFAIVPVEDYCEPDADEEELFYRRLWKNYYDSIAIESRYNPRCRMSHMQKRYWTHLTEMNPCLSTEPIKSESIERLAEKNALKGDESKMSHNGVACQPQGNA